MRNLVFKNLTSQDHKKRVISTCETVEKQGLRTVVRKHFVCKLIEIDEVPSIKPLPQVYISRICNHLKQQESFSCRMKASLYAKTKGRLFLVLFGHSLKIDSNPIIRALT